MAKMAAKQVSNVLLSQMQEEVHKWLRPTSLFSTLQPLWEECLQRSGRDQRGRREKGMLRQEFPASSGGHTRKGQEVEDRV